MFKKNRFPISVSVILLSLSCLCPVAAQDEESGDYIHFKLGLKYKEENKYDLATEEFRKVLAAYPDNFNAYMHMAEISIKQKKYDAAVFNLKKAIAGNPGWSKAYRMLAETYEADKQYETALKEFQRYQELFSREDPQGVQKDIDRLVAVISGVRPKPDNSKTQVPAVAAAPVKGTAAQDEAGSDIEFKSGIESYKKAVETGSADMYENALAHFRKSISLSSANTGAFYYAGLIRRRNGQNEMARINFLKAVSYPELGYNAHFYLGKIYGERKEYQKAAEHYKAYLKAAKSEEGRREAESFIAQFAKMPAGKSAASIDIPVKTAEKSMLPAAPGDLESSPVPSAEAALQEDEKISFEVGVDSLLSMSVSDTFGETGKAMMDGVKLFRTGRFDSAIETFKTLLVRYPRGDAAARIIYNIGICFFKLRNFQSADAQFHQIIDRYPSHELAPKSLFFSALSALEQRDWQTSERLFRKFIQADPSHKWTGRAYEKLGDAYIGTAEYKKAIDAYSEAAGRYSNPADAAGAYYKLGTACQSAGIAQKALEAFSKAISVGEKNGITDKVPESYYKLADYHYSMKAYEKALEYYTIASGRYKSFHDTPWGLFQIGNIYKNMKNYEKAVRAYDELMNEYRDEYWAGQAKWKKDDALWENEYKTVLQGN